MVKVLTEYLKEGWPYTITVVLLMFLKLTGIININWWLVFLPLYFWWPMIIIIGAVVLIYVFVTEFIIKKIKLWFIKK
tara:strand:+ start:1228 stop:1461 length:234 start_codon:yes stop_codon:yes gene_type:complete